MAERIGARNGTGGAVLREIMRLGTHFWARRVWVDFRKVLWYIRLATVDLDKLPQQGCPACGYLAKTAVLWPKTTPAQVPLAPAKTPLRRPPKR